MSIESALYSYLTTHLAADTNLAAVGTVTVYPERAPQSASYPFILYSMLSSDTENNLNHQATSELTLTSALFDLSIYAQSISDRALILKSVKDALHGHAGDIGTESLNIRHSVIETINTFSEQDLTGADLQIYRASITLNLTFNWS